MRPNAVEVLRGVQGSLMTYIMPEVEGAYARSELVIANTLLGIVSAEWDGAAQRLVEDNASLRALASDAAGALDGQPGFEQLAAELRTLAAEVDGSVIISELTAANGRLRDAIGRLGVELQGTEATALAELRAAVIAQLQTELEGRALPLLGSRADG